MSRDTRAARWTTPQRLVVTLTAAVTIVLAVTGLLTVTVVRSFINDRIDTRLVETAQRVRASLVGMPDLRIDRDTADNMARSGAAGVILVVGGDVVALVNIDPETARLAVDAAGGDADPHRVAGRPDTSAIRVDVSGTGLTFDDGGRQVRPDALVVAISTARESAALRTITGTTLFGLVAAVLALIGLTVLIVGRGLRPLGEITRSAEAYASGDRTVRMPETSGGPDIVRLAHTLNEALDAQHEAEQRLRSFVADASHELRTPLTIAAGWMELDAQGGLPDPDRRAVAVDRVQAQLSRMRLLIDELSLLARFDRERPLTLEDLDLSVLAQDVVADARLVNPDRVFVVRASRPAPMRGDVDRLEQVLANLVGNAVKHTPDGTLVEVTVVPAGTVASWGPSHTVLVTDHGPGIPLADQPRVFERFWRGDLSRHRRTGGSGLGLAIVASIVTAHGGTYEVISAPGSGTTFRLRLPAGAAPVRSPAVVEPESQPVGTADGSALVGGGSER